MTSLRRVPASSPPVAPTWSGTPNVTVDENDIGSDNILAYVTAGNIATDVITLVSGSLPAGFALPAPGNLLNYDGTQAPGLTTGLVYGISRSGGAVVNSPSASIDVDAVSPVVFTGQITAQGVYPPGYPDGLMGESKHLVMLLSPNEEDVHIIGGDWNPGPPQGTGVAPPPTGTGASDGRNEKYRVSFSAPQEEWAIQAYYWPSSADTGGFFFPFPDDAGGATVNDEFFIFRSATTLTFPVVNGYLNYNSALVGTLISGNDNTEMAAIDRITGHHRYVGPTPAEMRGNKCWGGVYHAATGKVYWPCTVRLVCATDAATGADVTPRHPGGAAAVMGAGAVLDVPNTCNWQIPRGFIAPGVGVDAGSDCLWVWDTANQWIVAINLTKYQTWNSGSGVFTGGLPARRIKQLPPFEDQIYSGQANTSLIYDEDSGVLCAYGLKYPGYLHMVPLATIETDPWVSELRQDTVLDGGGNRMFAQRHVYVPQIKATFAAAFIDFTYSNIEVASKFFIVKTSVPTWKPPIGEVRAVTGPGTSFTSTIASVMGPRPSDDDWNGGGNSPQSWLAGWSSGGYQRYSGGEYGSYFRLGGGDLDGLSPQVVRLRKDYNNLVWESAVDTYDYPGVTVTTATAASAFLDTNPNTLGQGEAIGTHIAPGNHNYDNIVAVDERLSGNPGGAIYMAAAKFVYKGTLSAPMPRLVLLSDSTNVAPTSAYVRAASSFFSGWGGNDGSADYDTLNKRLIRFNVGQSPASFPIVYEHKTFSVGVGSSISQLSVNSTDVGGWSLGDDPVTKYIRDSDMFVMVGRDHNGSGVLISSMAINIFDLNSGVMKVFKPSLNIIDDPIPLCGSPGWAYVPRLRSLYYRQCNSTGLAANAQKVWRFQIPIWPDNPFTTAWDVTTETMPGDTVIATDVGGLAKAFCYSEIDDVIQWCDNINGNTYMYTPPGS